ncbi:MAG TPA: hypothetical protein VIP09_16075 [Dehalococcoidia bacterium]
MDEYERLRQRYDRAKATLLITEGLSLKDNLLAIMSETRKAIVAHLEQQASTAEEPMIVRFGPAPNDFTTAPAPSAELWRKHKGAGGMLRSWEIRAYEADDKPEYRTVAWIDKEVHADRIIADHAQAAELRGLRGRVEVFKKLIRDRLSLNSGAMTFYAWQDKARAALTQEQTK